jgi:GH18 family chitinase
MIVHLVALLVGSCQNKEQISNKSCVSFFTQYPSIGGWTLSDNFPSVSANPTAREKFAENCIKILSYYQFDGVS